MKIAKFLIVLCLLIILCTLIYNVHSLGMKKRAAILESRAEQSQNTTIAINK